jgi:hypothetical protein
MTKIIQTEEYQGVLHALGDNGKLYWFSNIRRSWEALPDLPEEPSKTPCRDEEIEEKKRRWVWTG